MLCNKCFNNDLCYLHSDNFMDDAQANGFCGKFIDARKVMTFPVEVGDTVWYLKNNSYKSIRTEPTPITVTEINKKAVRKKIEWGFVANGTRYKFNSIGKSVFLSEKDAWDYLKNSPFTR